MRSSARPIPTVRGSRHVPPSISGTPQRRSKQPTVDRVTTVLPVDRDHGDRAAGVVPHLVDWLAAAHPAIIAQSVGAVVRPGPRLARSPTADAKGAAP